MSNTEFKCENCQNHKDAPGGRHCVPYIEKPPMMNMDACPGKKPIVLAPIEGTNQPTGEYLHLRKTDPTVTRSNLH